MFLVLIPPHFADHIGVFGFGLYVMSYTLLTLRILTASMPAYFCLNLTAASCVLIGLSVNFNLASALIQCFWVAMSLVGLALTVIRPGIA